MPRVKNKGVLNIAIKQYGSISFHGEVGDIIPQFFTTIDNGLHGLIITIAYLNKFMPMIKV